MVNRRPLLLRAGDYFVGRCRKDEFHISGGVGFKGFGNVQGGEFDFLVPVSVGVIVAAGVEDAVGYRIIVDFFGVSIAKN